MGIGQASLQQHLWIFVVLMSSTVALSAPSRPYEDFRIKTDNVPQAEIDGWILPAKGKAKGTVFLCHGYGNNKEYMVGWQWIREEGWNVVMFDFREHGESSRSGSLSSLGYHEIWDLKAVIDHAQTKWLAQPYCIYGRSMGAAIGLRWASQDARIAGVLACSPFVDAYKASRQVASMKTRVEWPMSPFVLHNGFKQMLRDVDIPKAVAQRDDLRIWILAGEYDCFPAAYQEQILAASASPSHFKHLLIAPGKGHSDNYTWRGNAVLPSHDQYIRQFLADCQGRKLSTMIWIPGTAWSVPLHGLSPWVLLIVVVVSYLAFRRYRRRAKCRKLCNAESTQASSG